MTVRLPLFPLGAVLFPSLLLPLHVFEDRYRAMVHDLLELPAEQRLFGVVAIREGREVGADGVRALHAVGCVARLRRAEPYADGRFDIVGTGADRFRVLAVHADPRAAGATPYVRADVELLDEPPGPAPEALVPVVRSLFTRYRLALGGAGDLDLSGDPTALSYEVAAGAVLDVTEKQRLLEAADTTTRLRLEVTLLRRETALFGQLPSLPGVELTRVPASPN